MTMVPLVRPSFPPVESWLSRWKASTQKTGIYSNFGPLWHEVAERLSNMTGMIALPCSTGTEAVALAIQAAKSQRDVQKFDVEAFTFEATHIAAERFKGFCRVVRSSDIADWNVRTIPFGCGRRIPDRSIVDAAGGFGPGIFAGMIDTPTAVSFHATKNFPIGEGGCVFLPPDWEIAARVVQAAMNFGFDMDRRRWTSIEHVGNGKLDELRCALLLAQLDRVDYFAERSARIRIQTEFLLYRSVAKELITVPFELGRNQSLLVVQIEDPDTAIESLAEAGFVARRIYSPNRFEELLLPEERNLIALPSDMTQDELERCAEVLAC